MTLEEARVILLSNAEPDSAVRLAALELVEDEAREAGYESGIDAVGYNSYYDPFSYGRMCDCED